MIRKRYVGHTPEHKRIPGPGTPRTRTQKTGPEAPTRFYPLPPSGYSPAPRGESTNTTQGVERRCPSTPTPVASFRLSCVLPLRNENQADFQLFRPLQNPGQLFQDVRNKGRQTLGREDGPKKRNQVGELLDELLVYKHGLLVFKKALFPPSSRHEKEDKKGLGKTLNGQDKTGWQ